jgi:hypothetical protein
VEVLKLKTLDDLLLSPDERVELIGGEIVRRPMARFARSREPDTSWLPGGDSPYAGYCNVLPDDGMSYGDCVEQLTCLLFLKMADERSRPGARSGRPIVSPRPPRCAG